MPYAPLSSLTRRILARLECAEVREPNPHFQDDYRIAWITTLHAAQGYLCPHVSASYAVLGLHPEKVWPALLARRRALLGETYLRGFAEMLPPKKPVRPVSAFPALRRTG